MWEVYVVFVDRAGRTEKQGVTGGINLMADSLTALCRLLLPYHSTTHKVLSVQRLRLDGEFLNLKRWPKLARMGA